MHLRFKTLCSAGLLAAAALLSSCSDKFTSVHASQGASQGGDSTRKAAADFVLQDANGTATRLSDFRGKVVLLNFWATWCSPCAMEIPWFIEFERQYRAQGLEVVGISMDDEGWKVVKPYIEEHKLNYHILMGTESVGQLYGGVDSLPTTFLIDRQGRIAKVHVGLAGKSEYLDEIQSLLGDDHTGAKSIVRREDEQQSQSNSAAAGLRVIPAVYNAGPAK